MESPPANSDSVAPFEIALVMAGAISAGAYTAGVIDFLIQALDEWEAAKAIARDRPDEPSSRECPMHGVHIKAMAGSSAGGMTAGLAAGLLGMEFESVTAPRSAESMAEPWNNTLYRSWVSEIDIDRLLETRDLDSRNGLPVQSLLDSTVLRDIARDAFRFDRPERRALRPYVSDSLHVFVTLTNLRGVPYAPHFENWPKLLPYEMTMHADHMHFVVGNVEPADGDSIWLNPRDYTTPETWGVLQDAALATGAFPIGLAPVLLKRPPAHYAFRHWVRTGYRSENPGGHWKSVPPNWPSVDQAVKDGEAAGTRFDYEFLCVDGGVMNNEPLDLARRILEGPEGTEVAGGDRANRAVLMVLPFPNGDSFSAEYRERPGILGLLATTFHALIGQARFKPQELAMANDPEVYSRFLVVPRRGFRKDGTLEPHTIACGSLDGFGGFLSRKFREHDYQLGRRNCQWFLRHYFVLPSEGAGANSLFKDWTPEARRKHRVLKAGAGGLKDGTECVLPVLPIIPLVGTADETVREPVWPTLTAAELKALKPKIKRRLGRVVSAMIDQNVSGWFWGPLARRTLKAAWWFKMGSVTNSILKKIRDELTERGSMAQ